MEFSAVMIDRAFPCHKADSSLQSISFLPGPGNQRRIRRIGFVTFVESNAKALLTAVPSIKSCLCALPGAFPSYGRSGCSRRFASAAIAFRIAESTFSTVHSLPPAQPYQRPHFCRSQFHISKISLSAAILRASLS